MAIELAFDGGGAKGVFLQCLKIRCPKTHCLKTRA